MGTAQELTLYGTPGFGSVFVEAQLVWYDMDYQFISMGDVCHDAKAHAEMAKINPLGQVPALKTLQGLMTESAAMTLWLADIARSDTLVPGPESEDRMIFLRWLLFIVCNIYPTFTYGDIPERFVEGEEAQEKFRARVDSYAKSHYQMLNEAAQGPWFLGKRFSAIDIFICGLTHWRPGTKWFKDNTAMLYAISHAALYEPKLEDVWARNFKGS